MLNRSLFGASTLFLAVVRSGLACSRSPVLAAGSEYVESYERDSLLGCLSIPFKRLSRDAEIDLFPATASLGFRITVFDSRGSISGSLFTFGLRNWKSFRF